MSGTSDPTAGIMVSGGVTFVETADLVAAALVVGLAVQRVDAALVEARRAHGLVSGSLAGPSSSVRWVDGAAACYPGAPSLGGVPGSWVPVPAEVVAARAVLLEEIVALTDALVSAEGILQGLIDRLRKAAGIYEEGESGAEAVVSWLASVPGVGIGVVMGMGVVDVVKGVATGHGIQLSRLLTGSGAYHDEAVRGSSVGIVRQVPWAGLAGTSSVGQAAGVLRGVSQSYRGLFARDVTTTELQGDALPAGFTKPVAHSAEALLSGIDVVYGKGNDLPDSVVSVEKYVGVDDRATWVVTVPGTQLGSSTTPFSMTSNFDLVQGADADSTAFVLEAMRQAEIPAGEEVVIVGHSQGGMVAMAVATAATGAAAGAGATGAPGGAARYDVRHVLTAGAPVGGASLPAGVRGTHVEIEQEGVSQLDGTDNPVGRDRVTVRADLEAQGAPGTGGKVPHGVPFHVAVLGRAREVGQPGLTDNLAAIDEAVSGQRVEARYFRGALELDPAAAARALTPLGAVGVLVEGLEESRGG
ncbi:alpha/beta fold hydrolase [Oerskovia sp. Root22]|uniref:alpha/beta fold hydrolase n=1 Tax=Oerskovia sp. Root22 TaxID=1736494 RepID=UPI0006F5027B|nr:alpha/beta fold hydrolase [Oerskovia sp. Root22]KRC42914.1 hypothetical protein ASE15_02735 [Oerskovia sp. Root22]